MIIKTYFQSNFFFLTDHYMGTHQNCLVKVNLIDSHSIYFMEKYWEMNYQHIYIASDRSYDVQIGTIFDSINQYVCYIKNITIYSACMFSNNFKTESISNLRQYKQSSFLSQAIPDHINTGFKRISLPSNWHLSNQSLGKALIFDQYDLSELNILRNSCKAKT